MRLRRMILMTGIAILSATLFVGCSKPVQTTDYYKACELLNLQYKLAQKLKGEGIQVVQVGEETTLILPADNFYYPYSNDLRSSSYKTLQNIIGFINTYPTVDIYVTGYTDSTGDYVRDLALSRAQAQGVADYLWSHGLNSRVISAVGKACQDDVASNDLRRGRAQNRRIEIFFRLPPPNNVFH